MHHIFFPPGLGVLTLQHQPHRLRTDVRDDAVLHGLFCEQLHRPAGASFRCCGACKSDDLRLVRSRKRRRLAGAGRIVESAVKTAGAVAPAYVRHMHRGAIEMIGNISILHADVGFEQDVCPADDPGRMGTGVQQRLNGLLIVSGQMNVVELHGSTVHHINELLGRDTSSASLHSA